MSAMHRPAPGVAGRASFTPRQSVARDNSVARHSASSPPSEAPSSHAESIQDRLSVVQQEIASRRSKQSEQQRFTATQCTDALSAIREQFHDLEERIAIQASDHRAELSLLENFVREALFRVEQKITGDLESQLDLFEENTQIVDEKIREIEQVVFQGGGREASSEEEQLGAVRREMNTAVEAARGLCEAEEDQAKRDLAELIEPNHARIRNLMDIMDAETRAVDRVVEDARAQLLQLAAPPQSRLEAKEKEIARGLKTLKTGLTQLRSDREMTFAMLYDSLTKLSQELIRKLEAAGEH
jgi:hypothetical protein